LPSKSRFIFCFIHVMNIVQNDGDDGNGEGAMTQAKDPVFGADWLDHAAGFPLAFAQVREDPRIDLWIADQLPKGARGIMIASGGCTAACLAMSGHFERLVLVDMNPAQLALTRLKLAWVSEYDPQDRLLWLGHRPFTAKARKQALLRQFERHDLPADMFGPIDTVAALGLDFAGRYERLFARLQYVVGDPDATDALLGLNDPRVQAECLEAHPQYGQRLQSAFDEVMALPNLVRLFGPEATQNATQPFPAHFFQRTLQVIHTLPAATNPYLAQLLRGGFVRSQYPWLYLPPHPIATEVTYSQALMAQALSESTEGFDFIHLSNILDWLDERAAAALLGLAAARLNPGGWLIIRQLNSRLEIPTLSLDLIWQTDIAAAHHAKDRSFFYQRLHMARPA
jgi:S-adenosylmethionine-diacylglycerol 3-amino-3-carboxypropyl transferase